MSKPLSYSGFLANVALVNGATLFWLVPSSIALIYGVGMRRIAQVKGSLTFDKNKAEISR